MDLGRAYSWVAEGEPPPVFRPETVEDARQWLVERNRPECGVVLAGGATHWYLGDNPSKATDILCLEKIDRVLDYSPADLTLEVEPGCRLETIENTLAKEGQHLPFLPLFSPDSTIGGVVSAAVGSPYAGALGGPRDYLIGIRVLHPEGIVSKAGGKVVKNVAGYDLCKLYAGALGTLGVIVRLAFKTRPLRGRPLTALVSPGTFPQQFERARMLRDEVQPAALEIIGEGGTIRVAARFLDPPGVAHWKRGRIGQLDLPAELLEKREERDFWEAWAKGRKQRLAPDGGQAAILLSTPLNRMGAAFEDLGKLGCSALHGSFQRGRLLAFCEEGDGLAEDLAGLRSRWNSPDDSVILVKAAPRLKQSLDAWGAPAGLQATRRRLKRQFDPNNVLNPGRL